jgi:hypothetical protein
MKTLCSLPHLPWERNIIAPDCALNNNQVTREGHRMPSGKGATSSCTDAVIPPHKSPGYGPRKVRGKTRSRAILSTARDSWHVPRASRD